MIEDLYGNDLLGDPMTLEEEESGALLWENDQEDRNEEDGGDTVPDFDVAQTEPQAAQPVEPKKKKVIRNPLPKLDPERLKGPRGISLLPDVFKDFEFRGKGYEKNDLNQVMKRLEHWAHRLFPKFQFDDCLEKLEVLGRKKPVMNYVKRIRMDLEDPEPTINLQNEPDDDDLGSALPFDPFDELLSQQISQAQAKTPLHVDPPGMNSPIQPLNTTLTEEQKERMKRNRLLAEERLLARLKAANQSQSAAEDIHQSPSGSGQATSVDVLEGVQLSQSDSETANQSQSAVDTATAAAAAADIHQSQSGSGQATSVDVSEGVQLSQSDSGATACPVNSSVTFQHSQSDSTSTEAITQRLPGSGEGATSEDALEVILPSRSDSEAAVFPTGSSDHSQESETNSLEAASFSANTEAVNHSQSGKVAQEVMEQSKGYKAAISPNDATVADDTNSEMISEELTVISKTS